MTRRSHERGSLMVELTLMIPLVLAVALLLLQGFFVLSTISAVEKAARDGARATLDGRSVSGAVHRSVPDWLTVESIGSGNDSGGCPGECVSVAVRVPLGVPMLTSSDVTITRAAAMPARTD